MAIITGGYDTFKSTLALEMAYSLATATPYLGLYPVLQPMRMAVIQLEIDPGSYDERLLCFPPTDNLLVASPGPWKLDQSEAMAIDLRDKGIDGIVLDPLGRMWPSQWTDEAFQENSNQQMTDLLTTIHNRFGTVILVHHDPKAGQGGMQNRARGASVLLNDPDTRLLVDHMAPNMVQVNIRTRLQKSIGTIQVKFHPVERRLFAMKQSYVIQ